MLIDPFRAADMSANHVRGWGIVREMNFLAEKRSFAENCEIYGQSISQWRYQPTYQEAQKRIQLFCNPLINFHNARWQQFFWTFFVISWAAFEISFLTSLSLDSTFFHVK